MTNNKTLRTLGFFVSGFGTGTVAALLFAPQSGERTRREVRRYINRKTEQLEGLQDKAALCAAELKQSISGCIADTKAIVDKTASSMANTLNAIQRRCA